MINQSGYSAFYAIRDNKVPEAQRKQYIKVICMSSDHGITILDNKLYKNDEEKQMVIDYLVDGKSEYAVRLLVNHLQSLTDEQISKVVQKCIKYSNSVVATVSIAEQIGRFNETEKSDIYDTIDLSEYAILDVITKQDYPQEYFIHFNEKYKNDIIIAKGFFARSGQDKNVNHPYRQDYFKTVMANKDTCESLLESKRFTQQEATLIYKKYKHVLRVTDNRGWNKLYDYCKLFYNCLDKDDQDILVDKLTKKSNAGKIPDVIEEIQFDQEHLDKLNAFQMVRKLRGLD